MAMTGIEQLALLELRQHLALGYTFITAHISIMTACGGWLFAQWKAESADPNSIGCQQFGVQGGTLSVFTAFVGVLFVINEIPGVMSAQVLKDMLDMSSPSQLWLQYVEIRYICSIVTLAVLHGFLVGLSAAGIMVFFAHCFSRHAQNFSWNVFRAVVLGCITWSTTLLLLAFCLEGWGILRYTLLVLICLLSLAGVCSFWQYVYDRCRRALSTIHHRYSALSNS